MTEHDEWANHRMTRKEFITYYAKNSERTETEILEAVDISRCECGDKICKGWQAIPKAYFRFRRRPRIPSQHREE